VDNVRTMGAYLETQLKQRFESGWPWYVCPWRNCPVPLSIICTIESLIKTADTGATDRHTKAIRSHVLLRLLCKRLFRNSHLWIMFGPWVATTQTLCNGLDIGNNILLLPGMQGAATAHAAHNHTKAIRSHVLLRLLCKRLFRNSHLWIMFGPWVPTLHSKRSST
jgi:hypothetical protein